jgi:hypothetical protein
VAEGEDRERVRAFLLQSDPDFQTAIATAPAVKNRSEKSRSDFDPEIDQRFLDQNRSPIFISCSVEMLSLQK